MTIEEYRNKLMTGTQGSGSSSASSGMSGYRETLAQGNRSGGLYKVYEEINLGYSDVKKGIQAGDAKATQSALARVRRNMEALRYYGTLLEDERILQDVESVQQSYQSSWLEYDKMKRLKAAEGSPMAAGLDTYNSAGGKLGTTVVGVDTEYMTGHIGDKWKDYTDAPDFAEYAARGAAIQNPALADAENAGSFFGKRVGGADIGNIVTYSRDNWEKIAMGEANGSTMQGRSIYKYMSGAEVNLYNYLLAKEGSARAQEYLDELEETLNMRMGGGQAQRISGIDNGLGRAAAMGLYAFDAGTDQAVSGMRQYLTKENLPTSPMQYGSQMLAQQLKGFGGEVYQAVQTVGNMLPSIAVGMLNPVAGAAATGFSSAGNAYGQALDEGYSEGQSRLYGTMVGAFEACMQYAMGGIGALGGVSAGKLLSKASVIDNAFLRIVAKLGVNIGSEIAEEELQLQLEPVLRMIILGDEYTAPTIQEMLETAVVTALSTGMLEGGGTVASDIAEGRQYRDIYGSGERELVEKGLAIDPQNTYAQKLRGQLNGGKSLSGHQIMNLVQQNEEGSVRQDMADIQSAATARLTELGETGDVHALGEILAKQAAGEALTRAEKKTLENSRYGQRVANELNAENIRAGGYASQWAERIGTGHINPEEYGRGITEELGSYKAKDGADVMQSEDGVDRAGEEENTPSDPAGQLPLPGGAAEAEETAAGAADTNTPSVSLADTSPSQGEAMERTENAVPDLMAREVEAITDINGLSEEQALTRWGREFARVQTERVKADARGDAEAAGVYAELNRLMGEAAVQGGGNIQATMAWLKGAIHGNDLSDGAGRRNAGERAGVEAGRVGPQRYEDNGRGPADGRADRPGYVQTARESAEDLGIPGGTSEKVNGRVPRERWTAAMEEAYDEAAALGVALEYVYGGIHVRNEAGMEMTVTGVAYGESIVVQADHGVYTPKQIADHELAHLRIKKDPAILMEAEEQLISQYGEMEIFNMVAAYAQGFRFCYGTVTEAMTADEIAELNRMYLEELVCDAYAGLNRHFVRSAGRNMTRYGAAVTEIMESRIGMGNGSGGMPGARYSLDPYTERQIENWSLSKKIVVYENDQQLMDFVSRALTDKNYVGKMYFGVVGEELAQEIMGATGFDFLGRNVALRAGNVRKTINIHGNQTTEERRGQRAVISKDFAMIPVVIGEPDSITASNYEGRAAAVFKKNIANERFTVVAVDSGGSLDLFMQTMYVGVKKESIASMADVNSPTLTPETIAGTAPNTSISETSGNSNTEFEGPKLRSNYPGLTEYDRWLEAREKDGGARFSAEDTETEDAGKAPEEMTAAELRKVVDGDRALLRAYRQIEKGGNMTPEIRAERDGVASRLRQEEELLKEKTKMETARKEARKREKAAATREEKKAAKERQKARTVPARATADFEKEMLDTFSTQSGMRGELGAMVRRFAQDCLQRGAVSYQDRAKLIDRLYEAGAVSLRADEYAEDIRGNIAGTRIYVDEATRERIGKNEYADFRREAFANGVILTSDKSDYGAGRVYARLQEQFPGKFRLEVDDPESMLEEIVSAAREGKAENVSLAEMMGRVEKDTGWSVADQMEAMERKVDAAIDKFIEKARLETELKARSAVQLAQEREERRKAMERQAEKKMVQEQRRRVFKLLQKAKRYQRQMPQDLKNQLNGIVEEMDTIAMGLANELRWSDKYQATWRDVVDMYKDAQKHDPNFLPNPEILQMIERLDNKKVADMEPEALQDMFDTITAIFEDWHNRKNMASQEEFALFSEVADSAIEELRASKGRKRPKGKIRGKIADGSWRLFTADQLTPVNFIEMMGGWRRDGAFFKAFGRQGENGERAEKAYKVESARMLEKFAETHADWMKTADGQGKDGVWLEFEVPVLGPDPKIGEAPKYIDTKTVWMTPMQRVHLYLESLNDQNMAHVQEGGRTFVDKELYSMGRRKEAFDNGVTVKISKETVKSILADMTAEEMAFARMLHEYYNVYSPEKINPVSNVILGYDKAIRENYAPIQTNESYNATQIGLFDITAEGVGVMKERVAKSGTPTYNVSALDAFERHVNQTARYVGYTIPVHNMQRLLNWKVGHYVADEDTGSEHFVIETTMMDEIKKKWGQQGVDAIVKYLNDMQGSKPDGRNAIQEIMAKVQYQYISATFGANPSVVLKQLGSFAMAGSELGFRNIPVFAEKVDKELIAKYTPELAYRSLSGATSEAAELKDNPNWTQTNEFMKFTFGGGAITWMDSFAAKALWPWAENYVRKNFPELEVGTREQIDAGQSPFYRKVAEIYNDAVTNTQSMTDISHRPVMQRSESELARGLTLFKSDSIQGYNMIRRHVGELARARVDKDKAAMRKARLQLADSVTGIILSNVWGQSVTLLVALIKNGAKWYRDDEGELTLESVGSEFKSGLIKNLAGTVVLGEELASAVLAMLNGESWSDDDDIELLIVEAVNDMKDGLATAGRGLSSVIAEAFEIQKNGGDVSAYLRKHTGEMLSYAGNVAEVLATYIGGLPVKNVKQYVMGLFSAALPGPATEMKNFFSAPTKNSLAGLKGESLEATVGDVLALRDIQADDGTAAELARLYEAGEKGSVPGVVKETFAVNGEDFTMNAAQLQEYERVYAEALGKSLDELVESDAYIEADDETRAKMLERLYDYAADTAKRAVAPEYEGDTWTRNAAKAEEEGVPVSAYAALQAQGLSKTADKVAYIDGMTMTDDQKGMLYYYAVASDARREDADAMMEAGMGWDTMYETMKQYMEIDNTEGMTAAQKAASFKTWAYNNLTDRQVTAAVENLTYSTGWTAQPESYDELTAAGLSADDALAVTTAWDGLEPEGDASTVSSLQKMNAVIETVKDPAAQMEALSSMLDDTNKWKLERAASYDVTAADYVEFKNVLEKYYDYDPEGSASSLSQDECTAALKSMGWLTISQKAVLWQIQTMGKDGKNNPFSTAIGSDVYGAYQDWKESGETSDSGTKSSSAVEPVGWTGNYPGLQLPVW